MTYSPTAHKITKGIKESGLAQREIADRRSRRLHAFQHVDNDPAGSDSLADRTHPPTAEGRAIVRRSPRGPQPRSRVWYGLTAVWLRCTKPARDSSCQSSMIAGGHERLGPYKVQDHELVGLK